MFQTIKFVYEADRIRLPVCKMFYIICEHNMLVVLCNSVLIIVFISHEIFLEMESDFRVVTYKEI